MCRRVYIYTYAKWKRGVLPIHKPKHKRNYFSDATETRGLSLRVVDGPSTWLVDWIPSGIFGVSSCMVDQLRIAFQITPNDAQYIMCMSGATKENWTNWTGSQKLQFLRSVAGSRSMIWFCNRSRSTEAMSSSKCHVRRAGTNSRYVG